MRPGSLQYIWALSWLVGEFAEDNILLQNTARYHVSYLYQEQLNIIRWEYSYIIYTRE